MAKRNTELEKAVGAELRASGFPYTAKYVEMFGINMNPWFWGPMDKQKEDFYKKCVEAKRPWDYFVDPPDEGIIL